MYKALVAFLLFFFALAYASEILYGGKPVSITVSGNSLNVIEFPGKIEKANSSNQFIQVKINGNKVVVKVPPDEKADLYVVTDGGRDYLLYLLPEDRPPELVKVIDTREKEKTKACDFEREHEYEETIARLIGSVLRGDTPPGYGKTVRTFTVETPAAIFVFLEEYSGWDYKVIKAQVINKLNKTLRIREDMRFVRDVLKKVYSGVYAIALTKEFLAPVSSSVKDSSAFMVAVVPNAEAKSSKVSEVDMLIKKFLQQQ